MGYCGIKIAEHSGTDFKNKKVYSNYNKLLNKKTTYTNVHIEQREQAPSFLWYNRVKLIIVITFFSIFLFLLSAYGTRLNNISIHKSQVSTRILESNTTKEKQAAAIMLYNSAKQYYSSGAINYAQDEITLVLNLYPTNIEALELMHKILDKQCETKNKFCDNAQEYRQYLDFRLKG